MYNANDHSEGVMVCLIPTSSEWCRIELPHLTLVYVGKVSDLTTTVYNELLKATMSLSMSYGPIVLDSVGVERFGDPDVDPVDVIVMEPSSYLQAMRRSVQEWNGSEHPFTPHVTIGPPGSIVGVTIPKSIVFDRIQVSWGEEQTSYKLFA